MTSNDGCDTERVILSLLALNHQAARDNPMKTKQEELQALGITDHDIQALVDGELSPEDQYKLQNLLPFYPGIQNRYEELLQQKEQLRRWWQVLSRRQ